MKLLLEHHACIEKDAYGITPLLAASVAGFSQIVEFLIDRPECSRSDRIDALELLGATYVDKKRDMLGAVAFWRHAMEERYSDNLNLIMKPKRTKTSEAYEHATEVVSIDQLDDLIADPDAMRMQALLVRERILGPAHPDTSYYIRYRGALYADMGNFDRCIQLWTYALDLQQTVLEPLSPMTQSSFLSFAELFSFMTTEWRNRPAHPVTFHDIMDVFLRAINELEKGKDLFTNGSSTAGCVEKDNANVNRLLVIIMHILCLICRLKPNLAKDEEKHFKTNVYRLINLKPVGAKGHSPLHLACTRETTNVGRYPVCSFPALPVINLLLEVGADPNALDVERNTPLHVAASNKPCRPEVFTLLLEHGAHIDTCNSDRKTPIQLLRGMPVHDIVSPLQFISLQCLAAKKIVKCAIPYKGFIPSRLEKFVELH